MLKGGKFIAGVIILGLAIVTGWILYAMIAFAAYWIVRWGADLFYLIKDSRE